MSTSTFDPRPLTEPIDRAAVAAHRKELLAAGRLPSGGGGTVGIVIAVAVFLFVGFFILNVFISLLTSFARTGGSPVSIGFVVVVAVMAVGIISLIVRGVKASHTRIYRLDRFARANGLTWFAKASNPPLPGMIFSRGSSRTASDILRGERPRFVEFANYRFTTGSGKNRTTHRWGYVAIKLATPLPHIVLDAEGNNGLFGSNLPQVFDKDQRLSLEGDFDRHFALYCPQGYEQDALYLFTPDIMARFIDHAAQLDVEIVDDWLFLYAKRDFSTLDPNTWAWLFSVVGALLDKLAQWERWRDDRLTQSATAAAASGTLPFAPPVEALRPPPGVAAGGQRLKTGIPWAAIVVVGVFAVGFFALQSGIFGAFFR
ncbi:hypothetical protein KZX37_02850 [Microbacterium sp. EYE_5]|uniref:hypothetical protein n=1 Tax=unclassified Microbacterium TaxID=2609290 RepID=UPI002003D778|nr:MULTISPECIES: hypothetical protein [unclassified Microbacterium]MCK6079559.1 hypothetical protein [Microbacterium sp. EYE_382]MCK6084830.1 hypothetical protein [Microbacterium sp. EYE_384]MCK6122944.1 hypothetical protein [Microbacterium sp. EYE_80]MCK6125593.1 hypothetical protein [Microbacterium sp. EYE_79]MCK6140514.1 hypothetical protein [Microbacterium sp. EYE_39]